MKKYLTLNINQKITKDLKTINTGALVVGCHEGKNLNDTLKELDLASDGLIKKLTKRGEISGKAGHGLYIPSLQGIKSERVYVLGCGKKGKRLPKEKILEVLKKFVEASKSCKAASTVLVIPSLKPEGEDESWVMQQLGVLAESSMYVYETKLGKKDITNHKLKRISISFDTKESEQILKKKLKIGQVVGQGSNEAKSLANLPGNICTPSYIAKASRKITKKYRSLSCKVLGEREMRKMGMDCLLSVGAGSAQESKLISLSYKGSNNKNSQPYVLVGKGITFDTGGISLKPGGAMDEMKFDMCGAASVFGTMQVVAELKLPINVVGIIASAENMPGSKATKPGDVVRTMSGITVEILNTDAEGRLVLADALTFAKRFKPKNVIDIATLTGACVVALGQATTGLMSNDKSLANDLLAAGDKATDRAWQLPLWEVYQKDLDSNFADLANIGGRAGTITAACFLSRFTKEYSWAHLDIAGTAWYQGRAKGASGRPVPLLSQYLVDKS